jgi:hypothetical protein
MEKLLIAAAFSCGAVAILTYLYMTEKINPSCHCTKPVRNLQMQDFALTPPENESSMMSTGKAHSL